MSLYEFEPKDNYTQQNLMSIRKKISIGEA